MAPQSKYKQYYDRSAKPLVQLQPGDTIRYRESGVWEPTVVIEPAGRPRSYVVENEHGLIQCNR